MTKQKKSSKLFNKFLEENKDSYEEFRRQLDLRNNSNNKCTGPSCIGQIYTSPIISTNNSSGNIGNNYRSSINYGSFYSSKGSITP